MLSLVPAFSVLPAKNSPERNIITGQLNIVDRRAPTKQLADRSNDETTTICRKPNNSSLKSNVNQIN